MNLRAKTWTLMALSAVVLAIAAACGSGDDEGAAVPSPDVAQVFRAQLSAEPESLDPAKAGFANEVSVLRQIFRGLVYFDQDLNVAAAAAADLPTAENGGISEDGLVYTFELRPDLQWSDGSALTAGDWEYAFKRFFDPTLGGAQYYQGLYYDIAGAFAYHTALGTPDAPASPTPEELATLRDGVGVEAIDADTLQVTLEQPRPTFLYLMALWPASPVPQAVVEQYGDAWTEPGNFVGNGPFVITGWDHNQRIVLERNPYFYGPDAGLERVEFVVLGDPTTAYQAYQNDELDYTSAPPALIADLRNDAEFHSVAEMATFALSYNNQAPPFDDPLVRRAFAQAIDRQAYVDLVLQGIGQATTAWIPPGMPGHDAEAGTALQFDPDSAKELLATAGYPNGDGLPAITITSISVEDGQLAAEFVQAQWAQNLGINAGVEILDPAAYGESFGTGQYQVTFSGWGSDYPHPENWIPALFGTGGGANQYLYSNARVDDLIERAVTEADPVAAIDLYVQAQTIILDEDAGIAPIYHLISTFLVKDDVLGLVYTASDGEVGGDLFLSSPDVHIAAASAAASP